MVVKTKLIKLTKEAIARLPYPETAKILGGILVVAPSKKEIKLANKLLRSFRKLQKERKA